MIDGVDELRGCSKCELYFDWLPGCPQYCAKWALRKDESERTWRDKEIIKAYEDRRKK